MWGEDLHSPHLRFDNDDVEAIPKAHLLSLSCPVESQYQTNVNAKSTRLPNKS